MNSGCPAWYIQLFDGPQATHTSSGRTIRFPSHRVGALLAYLALPPGRPRSREELADMFWPESETGRVNLRTVLSALRRELEPEGVAPGSILVTNGHADVCLSGATVETDAARFERLLKATYRPSIPPDEQALRLSEAVAVHTGPLLPGFYEDWAVAERDRLAALYLDALGRLCDSCERAGDLVRAAEFARRAVDADPLSEEAHLRLIRQRIAAGDRVGAVRQYQEMERLLKERLGVGPGTEASTLIARVQGGALPPIPAPPAAAGGSPFPGRHPGAGDPGARPWPGTGTPPGFSVRLPPTFTEFYGREEESRAIDALLRSGNARLVTITGLGGSGKTRFAIETARRVADTFSGGVVFVPLAEVREAGRIPQTVANALGLPGSAGIPLPEQIAGALQAVAPAPILLVLDNFEQIAADGAQFVQSLVAAVPTLCCLVTSRHRLWVEAETEFGLAPLPVPQEADTPERLLEFPGVRLFVSRARAARADFALDVRNADAVARLCGRLEGIPLALELAAAWAQTLTPGQMLARLDRRFDLLVARRRDLPERHATLRATVAWGVDLLPPAARDFFARLSAFRGGFTLDAAEQVCEEPDALALLANLGDHSLLVAEQPNGTTNGDDVAPPMRYRMLETVREFAAEQERQQSTEREGARLRARHAAYYLSLAEEAEPHLRGVRQRSWLDRLQQEHANLEAALDWSLAGVKAGDPGGEALGVYLRLCGTLWPLWLLRGHLAEAARWLLEEDIPAFANAAPDEMSPLVLARALYARAEIAYIRHEMGASTAAMEQALAFYRQAGDRSGEGLALARLARRKRDIPSLGERRQMVRTARRLCRAAGDPWAEAEVLTEQAWLIRCVKENYPRAHRFMARAVALYRAAGDTGRVITALRERGTWYAWAVQTEQARPLLDEALSLARSENNPREIGFLLWTLGYMIAFSDEPAPAADLFREGARVAQAIGDGWCLLLNLTGLGLALLNAGEDEAAQAVFRESLPLARRTTERNRVDKLPELYFPFEGLALIAARRGDLHRAARLLGVTWAMGRPGPDEMPSDFPPAVNERYRATRAEMNAMPGGLLREWERGRVLGPVDADRLALHEGH